MKKLMLLVLLVACGGSVDEEADAASLDLARHQADFELIAARGTSQPYATFTTPLRLTGAQLTALLTNFKAFSSQQTAPPLASNRSRTSICTSSRRRSTTCLQARTRRTGLRPV